MSKMSPLNFQHRIVLVVNVDTRYASACFVPDFRTANMAAEGARVGVDVQAGGRDNATLVLICPEDLIEMREASPPPDLREAQAVTIAMIERLLAANIDCARPMMVRMSPS